MIWLEILFLAVVQGITEFLPVSSSGHIVVGLAAFEQSGHPVTEKLTVSIVLHVGTLLAILVFYRQRILALLGRDARMMGLLAVGSVPAAIVGVGIKATPLGRLIEQPILENPLVAGFMFPLTGLMLLWSSRCQAGETLSRDMKFRDALLVGLFQALAILPGISRSGSTIVAGLRCGLRRDEAAAFSFLLAIPAIGGAGLIEAVKLASEPTETVSLAALGAGGLASFLVGLATLAWLVRWLKQGRLHFFAWWVIPLGALVVAWQLWGW